MMKNRRPALVVSLACAGALLIGCSRRSETQGDVDLPLATVGGKAITEADFQFEVQRRLQSGRPVEDAGSMLQSLIEREVMLQRAQASEHLADPDVQREIENQVLVKWLDQVLHSEKDRVTVSDDELRDGYEAHRDEFTRPALVRLAILYRKPMAGDTEETPVALRRELDTARALFLQSPEVATQGGRLSGFGTLAADHSEHTVSRYRGGDLGWLDPARQDHRLPAVVLDTGLSLPVGAVSDVLATDGGLYVVMKTGQREPQVTPFEEAAASLRRRIIREKQQVVEQHFRQTLLQGADIVINADKAAALVVPTFTAVVSEPPPPSATRLP